MSWAEGVTFICIMALLILGFGVFWLDRWPWE